MRRIEHYVVVESKEVQELVDNGWQPYGGPLNDEHHIYQAMVMYEAEQTPEEIANQVPGGLRV